MAEEKVVNLKINNNIDDATSSVKSLKAQLREAQNEVTQLSDKFGATSREAIEAAKRAAQLKDAIGDAKALTDAFNPDAKFKSLSASLTGVAGGFSAVTGTLGLMGAESADVEKAILKVQSAMALASGLQAVGEARDSFKQLGAVAVNALKGIKTGIAATGIGVLLVALGTIVAYWDEINALVSDNTDTLNDYAEAQGKVTSGVKDFNVNLINVKNSFDAARQGTISKQAALKQYNDTLGKSVGYAGSLEQAERLMAANTSTVINGIKLRTQAQVFYAKSAELAAKAVSGEGVEVSFLDNVVNYIKSGGNAVAYGVNNIKTSVSNLNNITKQSKTLAAEGDKLTQQAIDNDKKLKAGLAEPPKPPKTAEQSDKQLADEKKRIDDELTKSIVDNAKSLKEINDQALYEAQDADAQLSAISEANIAKQDADKKAKGDYAAWELNLIATNYEAGKKIRDKQIEDEKIASEARRQIRNLEIEGAQQLVAVLAGLFEKNKGIQKAALIANSALSIAQIINNTNVGSSKEVATKGILGLGTSAILYTKMGLSIASVLVATANGLKGLGGGGATSPGSTNSGGGGQRTEPLAPQFNVVGTSGVNQIAQLVGAEKPIVKAYVVASDVSTAQALDRNIIKSSSLG